MLQVADLQQAGQRRAQTASLFALREQQKIIICTCHPDSDMASQPCHTIQGSRVEKSSAPHQQMHSFHQLQMKLGTDCWLA